MARKKVEEEHENHERWMVTYADMVTLLMVLFIVMFSMSQVDERKFNELREGLAAGFGQSALVMDGGASLQSEPGSSAVKLMRSEQQRAGMTDDQWAAVEEVAAEQERLRRQRKHADARAEAARLEDVAKRLRAALLAEGLEDDVETRIDERGLVVSLVSRHVVFEANLPSLSARGREVIDTLAPALARLPDPLQIDGHTNQVPVKPKYFDTDWDLSSARAITVLRRLNETHHIPGERLTAAAYGHEKPLLDPALPRSQAINKRVDIVVLSSLSPETRELLDDVIRQQGEKS